MMLVPLGGTVLAAEARAALRARVFAAPRGGGMTHNAERAHRSKMAPEPRSGLAAGGSGAARGPPRCGQAFHGVGMGGEQQVLDPGWVDIGDVDLGQAQLHRGELGGVTGQP